MLAVLLIIVFIAIAFTYSAELKFQAVMLKYSNIFLFDSEFTFFYIPIFLLLACGFLALIWFQNMAFQSSFAANNDRWNYANAGVLSFLNLIELIWGLQFLRDACKSLFIKLTSAFLETQSIGIGRVRLRLLPP